MSGIKPRVSPTATGAACVLLPALLTCVSISGKRQAETLSNVRHKNTKTGISRLISVQILRKDSGCAAPLRVSAPRLAGSPLPIESGRLSCDCSTPALYHLGKLTANCSVSKSLRCPDMLRSGKFRPTGCRQTLVGQSAWRSVQCVAADDERPIRYRGRTSSEASSASLPRRPIGRSAAVSSPSAPPTRTLI